MVAVVGREPGSQGREDTSFSSTIVSWPQCSAELSATPHQLMIPFNSNDQFEGCKLLEITHHGCWRVFISGDQTRSITRGTAINCMPARHSYLLGLRHYTGANDRGRCCDKWLKAALVSSDSNNVSTNANTLNRRRSASEERSPITKA